jgi:chromosome segregation ATPase
VFGATPSPDENHRVSSVPEHQAALVGDVGPASAENAAVESASAEIEHISGAIAELQGRLERANNQLGQVTAVRTTELEIGRLFVEAQRFSEASLSKLEMQIQEILAEAEAKATQILREATAEAHEIRREAQQSAFFPARTAQELQAAIAGFSSVNSELVKELGALNAMLTHSSDRGTERLDGPSSALGST